MGTLIVRHLCPWLPPPVRDRHLGIVLRLTRLVLTDFRTYAALTWRPSARISVLYGPNGSGKTNLLEAVSLLVPGRGLRGARIADLPRQPALGGGGEEPHRHNGDPDNRVSASGGGTDSQG